MNRRLPTGTRTCVRCGKQVPALDARRFGDRTLCWRCYWIEVAAWAKEEEKRRGEHGRSREVPREVGEEEARPKQ